MKILYISYDFPFPPTGGSISRDFNLIKQMARENELHWINRTVRGKISQDRIDEMGKYFTEMEIAEWDYNHSITGLIKSLFTDIPYIIRRFASDRMKETVSKYIRENNYDLILCDHIYLAQYLPDDIAGKIPVIPNNEDCGYTFYKRMSEQSGFIRKMYAKSQWKKLLKYEIEILKKYKVYITTSEKEKELLSSYYNGAEIKVIENGVDTDYFYKRENAADEPALIFTAWFGYYPNEEAAVYFTKKILPLVRKEIKDVKFIIAGKEPSRKILELASDEGVIVTGYVDDIRDYLKNAAAAVIPLKVGGGTRLKILEAFSMGVPVISTEIGAEGINAEINKDILIGKDDTDFAEKIIKVLKNKKLAGMLSENGRALAESEYDWNIIGRELNRYLNEFVNNFNKENVRSADTNNKLQYEEIS
ncbi:MAG TPA: glycosyltransferase family 4 protein [Ignavibacteria bacterium]|nr:hypothetical protein [Bacteroidota bacterium]HRI84541.1 glycosyltransferase family 4 protein [Ignavibacteria bacterium]HRJ98020.1 glycosyltransferase family 4 protein [Ignavibacteria bacterium]